MGDRANVAVVQDDGKALVYLYTHWGGSELAADVQKALAKNWRWDDGAYLTRIIFDTMTDGSHGQETGFGIATSRCDNEHSIIVVDPSKQRVGFAFEDKEPACYVSWTFKEYIALAPEKIEEEYEKRAVKQ
jgi:hypothetical protein